MQRTLILLKPDAVERALIGEIIARFERVGAKIVGAKMLRPEKELAMRHYTEDLAKRRGENVRQIMMEALIAGPIIALVLEGVEIVEVARKLIGETEPKAAAAGTIRGDYSHVSFEYANKNNKAVFNLIHASATELEAEEEIKVWFSENEILEYNSPNDEFTQ